MNRRRFLRSAVLGSGGILGSAVGINAMTPLIWHDGVRLDANASFWMQSQAPLNAPLTQDLTVDVAIIGGGLTGLSSAYYMRRSSPAKSVAVFEANGCGNGASGRNGAMVLTMTADRFMSFSDDPQRDKRLYDLTAGNVRALALLSASTGMDCDLDLVGTLQVCSTAADAKMARAYVEQARSMGMPVEYWDAQRVAAAIGSEIYHGGYYDPAGGRESDEARAGVQVRCRGSRSDHLREYDDRSRRRGAGARHPYARGSHRPRGFAGACLQCLRIGVGILSEFNFTAARLYWNHSTDERR